MKFPLSRRESETLVISFVGNLDVYRYSLTVSRMEKFLKILLPGIKMCFKAGVVCNQIKKSSGSSFFLRKRLAWVAESEGATGYAANTSLSFVGDRQ